jgi:predicted DNA-binding transcriptional regulator AlpA
MMEIWLERRNYMVELNQQLVESVVHSSSEPVHRANALLDIIQAAEYLGMSVRWLYRHYNILPHIRIGFGRRPRIRFRQSDLDAWVRQHRIAPTGLE